MGMSRTDVCLTAAILNIIMARGQSSEVNTEGYSSMETHSFMLGCNTEAGLNPGISIDKLKGDNIGVVIRASLDYPKSDKGCGRDTYGSSETHKKCGIAKSVFLLPEYVAKTKTLKWLGSVDIQVTEEGGLDYKFAGQTAVRYPTNLLPPGWWLEHSLSVWLSVMEAEGRQYVLSWSDGESPRHDITGFYVVRRHGANHITYGFEHMHEDASIAEQCRIHRRWKTIGSEIGWHFVTLSFRGCSVELTIDGRQVQHRDVSDHFHMPELHIQPKFVVGSRYAGFAKIYDDYFNGVMSALALHAGLALTSANTKCLLKCHDRLVLASAVPDGLQFESEGDGSHIEVSGKADLKTIDGVLHDLVLVSEDSYPVQAMRNISIYVENSDNKTFMQGQSIVHISRTKTSIQINGPCEGERNLQEFVEGGVKLCPELTVNVSGCSRDVSEAVVEVEPELTKMEKVFIASPDLRRYPVSLSHTENGFVLSGMMDYTVYETLIQRIRYQRTGTVQTSWLRLVKVTLFQHNNLVQSNTYNIQLKVTTDTVLVIPNEDTSNTTGIAGVVESTTRHVRGHDSNHVIDRLSDTVPFATRDKASFGQLKSVGHSNHTWMILSVVLSVVVTATLAGYGFTVYRSSHSQRKSLRRDETETNITSPVLNDYFWDAESLPVRIIINPSERVSITNDPRAAARFVLEARPDRNIGDAVSTDDEDEEDNDSGSETDSIRQLEWDCLESSLDALLTDDKADVLVSLQGGSQGSAGVSLENGGLKIPSAHGLDAAEVETRL